MKPKFQVGDRVKLLKDRHQAYWLKEPISGVIIKPTMKEVLDAGYSKQMFDRLIHGYCVHHMAYGEHKYFVKVDERDIIILWENDLTYDINVSPEVRKSLQGLLEL